MTATDYAAVAARDYGRKLADQVAEYVNAKVQNALALESERYDAELNELREDVARLGMIVMRLATHLEDDGAYSVKAAAADAATERETT